MLLNQKLEIMLSGSQQQSEADPPRNAVVRTSIKYQHVFCVERACNHNQVQSCSMGIPSVSILCIQAVFGWQQWPGTIWPEFDPYVRRVQWHDLECTRLALSQESCKHLVGIACERRNGQEFIRLWEDTKDFTNDIANMAPITCCAFTRFTVDVSSIGWEYVCRSMNRQSEK